ncbi:beta-galactosidase [Streptomyces sp. NPDC048604]|uniref:beta-galactosidase n=1 Tax=Streptomyces sp. NPDC048604 TaxID=3365578 RepID=UPI003713E350
MKHPAGLTQRHWWFAGALAVILALLASMALLQADEKEEYHFGTLLTDHERAPREYEIGIRLAHLEVRWDRFEPHDDAFDQAYIDRLRDTIREFEEAGLEIEVGITLHSPPGWLREHPDSDFVNQYGDHFTDAPNVVFSQSVRREVQEYIKKFNSELGLHNFWAVRIGVSETGEFTYPPADPGEEGNNSFWAFDGNAQSTAGDSGRPPDIPPNPLPGWEPGDRTYQGRNVERADVAAWSDWYLQAIAQTVNWQISQYTSLGYQGRMKILVPGTGVRPGEHESAVNSYLDGTVLPDLMGRGVSYYKSLSYIRGSENIEIVSTSLVDGSGDPSNQGCAPSDEEQDILDPSNAVVGDWSSVRWIANLARYYGFDIGGESSGPQIRPYYDGVMDDAARQMTSCGLKDLMWAFDKNLYDGTPGSSLQEYGAVIDRLN